MTRSCMCIALALATLLLAGAAPAQDASYHGTSAANFLKIGLGARASGMADAYITQVEDASALYWNPGAMSRLARPSIIYSNLQWLVDTDLNYAAVTVPFSFGTLGLDLAYFTSGDIKETTLQEQDGTGRVVSASDLALGFTYARNLTDRFSFGLKVKYIRESRWRGRRHQLSPSTWEASSRRPSWAISRSEWPSRTSEGPCVSRDETSW